MVQQFHFGAASPAHDNELPHQVQKKLRTRICRLHLDPAYRPRGFRRAIDEPLIWNGFAFSVVISKLDGEYSGPHWILYKLVCSVIADAAAVLAGVVVSAASQVVADITSAGGLGVDTSALTTTIGPGGAVSTANASTVNADLISSITQANTDMANATVGLQSSDFTTALAAAQQTANLSFAMGYLSRAAAGVAQIQNGLG